MSTTYDKTPLGIWVCKIGEAPIAEGHGLDQPMRQAVSKAYTEVTGRDSDFIFSGWRGELTEWQRAVVEDRDVDDDKLTVAVTPSRLTALERAARFLEALEAAGVDNWEGYSYAVRAYDDMEGEL